ncbi:MAG: PAS domain S-box protein [Spirochaetaceae bacterium]|nr:PAS domain S-box protein [Spirochaetaceae bacterium]
MADTDRRLLLVEDQALIALAERGVLERAGYSVDYAATGAEAIARTAVERYDLVLMDVDLGAGMDGGEAARRMRAAAGPPVVFLSSHLEREVIDKTRDSGGYGFIVKGSGERVLLTSVAMALDLAAANRRLADSEERWRSLGRTAPDYIISFDIERRILFLNKVAEGQRVEDYLGRDIIDIVHPEDRPLFARRLESVVRDGQTVQFRVRGLKPDGGRRWWDLYMGPAFAGGRVERVTAVARDVTAEAELAEGGDLDPAATATEVEAAMADFDFAPVSELIERFHDLTGFPLIIRDRRNRTLVAVGEQGAFAEGDYRCAKGRSVMSRPIKVAGIHWATIHLGVFQDEGEAIDQERAAKAMGFAAKLGDLVMGMAFSAHRERLLAHHHRATETALDKSEKRFRMLAENAGDVIWTLDLAERRFTYVSPSIRYLRGISPEEAKTEALSSALEPDSLEKVMRRIAELTEAVARGDPWAMGPHTGIYRQSCADGSVKDVEISVTPVLDEEGKFVEVLGVSRDASDRVAHEAVLRESLASKDRLYAELQHRVKNSLALVVSLLTLEGGQSGEPLVRKALDESISRVRVIASLYERLFRTKSVGRIDLGGYVAELCEHFSALDRFADGIELVFEGWSKSLEISAERAVSAGLALFELVSNASQYAFPDGRTGTVTVSLRAQKSDADGSDLAVVASLAVADDGIGLPPGFSYAEGERLGSLLISQLTRQLGGTVSVGPGPDGIGTQAAIHFPL